MVNSLKRKATDDEWIEDVDDWKTVTDGSNGDEPVSKKEEAKPIDEKEYTTAEGLQKRAEKLYANVSFSPTGVDPKTHKSTRWDFGFVEAKSEARKEGKQKHDAKEEKKAQGEAEKEKEAKGEVRKERASERRFAEGP